MQLYKELSHTPPESSQKSLRGSRKWRKTLEDARLSRRSSLPPRAETESHPILTNTATFDTSFVTFWFWGFQLKWFCTSWKNKANCCRPLKQRQPSQARDRIRFKDKSTVLTLKCSFPGVPWSIFCASLWKRTNTHRPSAKGNSTQTVCSKWLCITNLTKVSKSNLPPAHQEPQICTLLERLDSGLDRL